MPFVDRLISADMSQDAARARTRPARRPVSGGLSGGRAAATPAGRFLSYFARAASVGAMMAPDAVVDDDDTIRQRTEDGLRPWRQGAPAVVLGRAGAVVLASRPRAFHVRLDGPVERRVAWAAATSSWIWKPPSGARARRTGPGPCSSSGCSGSTRPTPASTT